MKNYRKAFTLVEIMIGILIVSLIILGGFKAMSAVTIGKVRLIQETDIQKESFYFTEKLFEMIKTGGTLDYEEYFNRKVIGNTTYLSGHFDKTSGFGNFGSGGIIGSSNYGDKFYYCLSGVGLGNKLTGSGCYNNSLNTNGGTLVGSQQRYGQYSFQFIDYNSNYDSDLPSILGDEDNDGKIIGDDDDEYIGNGPEVFTGGLDLTELYLISGNKKERTLFRWNVTKDPNAPTAETCNLSTTSNVLTGSGCIGTVEFLKLTGEDWGMNHILSSTDKTYSDGVIDTWIIDKNFTGGNTIIAGTGTINWVPLFPNSINVSEFKVYGYPNKDISLAWNSKSDSVNISPYIILKLKLKPSWISRKKIKSEGKELDFSMTINLSDIYSK